jgi:hypothetical protein
VVEAAAAAHDSCLVRAAHWFWFVRFRLTGGAARTRRGSRSEWRHVWL